MIAELCKSYYDENNLSDLHLLYIYWNSNPVNFTGVLCRLKCDYNHFQVIVIVLRLNG